ncbi:HMCN1-like protein [Mya arenaria]|uniref:HMCN1-like protein n=1 Tax=Mya arenaria TaxID=6604 RepID=A0ABY7GD29_MYAAR|nr:HMCN1-like protein [Mya arenaria]
MLINVHLAPVILYPSIGGPGDILPAPGQQSFVSQSSQTSQSQSVTGDLSTSGGSGVTSGGTVAGGPDLVVLQMEDLRDPANLPAIIRTLSSIAGTDLNTECHNDQCQGIQPALGYLRNRMKCTDLNTECHNDQCQGIQPALGYLRNRMKCIFTLSPTPGAFDAQSRLMGGDLDKNALLLLFISKNTVSGISCLHCGNGVSDLAYCNRIVECPANEICYVEQYWLSKDTVAQYRAGCMPIQECEASKCQNKTSGGHDRACMECCYGKDGTVLNCYDCDGLQSNDHCSTVTSCPRDNEMCLFQHFPATQTFNVKCVKIAHCKVLDTAYEHVEPENRAAHCCNTTLCNWQQPGENTTVPKPVYCFFTNKLKNTACSIDLADGAWSNWLPWTQCDVTCGHGNRQRSRTCSNPAPSKCGLDCVGNTTETGDCAGTACPAFWMEWANSNCPVTCGVGNVWRMRACSTGNDADCPGDFGEFYACDEGPCDVDGAWSNWLSWTQCDVTCGHGYRQRLRNCSNPEPSDGGLDCVGNVTETGDCSGTACPAFDGGWEVWNDWSNCDVTCGHGHKQRTRTCSNPTPAHGGHNCTGKDAETASCNLEKCPGF